MTASRLSTCESNIAGKQDLLTFDSTPTEGSNNPVTSGGIYTAINAIDSGEVWEEVDLTNFPTDWAENDRVKIVFNLDCYENINIVPVVVEIIICPTSDTSYGVVYQFMGSRYAYLRRIYDFNSWNGNSGLVMINTYNTSLNSYVITRDNVARYVYKMWRLKK